MTSRDELLGKIAKGTAYIQRSDITPFDRERATTKLDELKAQLRKMDEPPPKVEDPRIPEYIAEIKAILKEKGAKSR